MVKSCEYKDENRMIRDKIVIGTNNSVLQKKLLETEALDLQKTIKIARNFELVEGQVNVIQRQQQNVKHLHIDAVNATTYHKSKTNSERRNQINKKKQAYRNNNNSNNNGQALCKICKSKHDYRGCPTFGKQCNNCGRLNHFSVACFASKIREIKETEIEDSQEQDIFLHWVADSLEDHK